MNGVRPGRSLRSPVATLTSPVRNSPDFIATPTIKTSPLGDQALAACASLDPYKVTATLSGKRISVSFGVSEDAMNTRASYRHDGENTVCRIPAIGSWFSNARVSPSGDRVTKPKSLSLRTSEAVNALFGTGGVSTVASANGPARVQAGPTSIGILISTIAMDLFT